MYSNIAELPTQVTTSLDKRDATHWMEEQNKYAKPGMDELETLEARRKAWESVKNAPSSFSFCIKASVEAIDKDKEVIDVQSIKNTINPFILHGGNLINEHGNYVVGCIWGWDPIMEGKHPGIQVWGNIFGGDQIYDLARKAFVMGRNNLSVAGEATEGHFMCDSLGCYTRRNVSQLLEISLCDVPANPKATMVWYNQKAKMTKSATVKSGLAMNVDSYVLHKDYTECPIQALKKSMLDAGYQDVHAKPQGVVINMSPVMADYEYPELFMKGYQVERIPDGLYVRDRVVRSEQSFRKALAKGYIDKTGLVQPDIPHDDFMMMQDTCMIGKGEDGRYRFRL